MRTGIEKLILISEYNLRRMENYLASTKHDSVLKCW